MDGRETGRGNHAGQASGGLSLILQPNQCPTLLTVYSAEKNLITYLQHDIYLFLIYTGPLCTHINKAVSLHVTY